MPQDLADGVQVRFVLEHGRGAGVPEGMGVDVLFDSGLFGVFFHQFPHHVFRQPVAPQGQEHVVVVRVLDQLRADGFDVVFKVSAGEPAQRNDPVLAALAVVDS